MKFQKNDYIIRMSGVDSGQIIDIDFALNNYLIQWSIGIPTWHGAQIIEPRYQIDTKRTSAPALKFKVGDRFYHNQDSKSKGTIRKIDAINPYCYEVVWDSNPNIGIEYSRLAESAWTLINETTLNVGTQPIVAHSHNWTPYIGLLDTFDFCSYSGCNAKRRGAS